MIALTSLGRSCDSQFWSNDLSKRKIIIFTYSPEVVHMNRIMELNLFEGNLNS